MKLRQTMQRDLVLDIACKLDHPTAEEVYTAASEIHPSISRGTVYRNLGLLVSLGKLRRVNIPGGPDHFDSTLQAHYHISCRGCGRVADADIPYQRELLERISGAHGYLVEEHDIMLRGLCPECLQLSRKQVI